MSAPRKTRAKARARKAVIPAEAVTDTLAAISLVEVTKHSLQGQEIGAPEQVVLEQALKKLWAVHDLLIEVAPDDDEDDDEGGDL